MNNDEILEQVASGKISVNDAKAMMDDSNDRKRGSLWMKVSEKGGVSVYGLQRMPVTLYQEQWGRLFAFSEQVESFIAENKAKLKTKDQPAKEQPAADH